MVTPTGYIPICYMSLDDLIKNNQLAGRPKDLDDLTFLRGPGSPLRSGVGNGATRGRLVSYREGLGYLASSASNRGLPWNRRHTGFTRVSGAETNDGTDSRVSSCSSASSSSPNVA